MKICVEIEMDTDSGQVTVGVSPPEEETGEPKGYMKPAQDIDSALAMAKDLLANPPAQGAEAGQEMGPAMAPGGGQMMGKMTPADLAWNKVSADRKAMG